MCISQDGSRVPFKVKKTTVFDKLFRAYCQKKALDQTTLVFMDVEGKRILPHQTPAEVCTLNPDWSLPAICFWLCCCIYRMSAYCTSALVPALSCCAPTCVCVRSSRWRTETPLR